MQRPTGTKRVGPCGVSPSKATGVFAHKRLCASAPCLRPIRLPHHSSFDTEPAAQPAHAAWLKRGDVVRPPRWRPCGAPCALRHSPFVGRSGVPAFAEVTRRSSDAPVSRRPPSETRRTSDAPVSRRGEVCVAVRRTLRCPGGRGAGLVVRRTLRCPGGRGVPQES